ncbi:MAG: PHP domain-containing protein [Dehalococcoidia bacterium]|nr:PHP domain-containing protein [Dehalococcoidia bacterium]
MDRVQALGQEAIAMTDHGALYGAIDFYREATARGIKPIIGVEAYVAPGSRHSRERGDSSPTTSSCSPAT